MATYDDKQGIAISHLLDRGIARLVSGDAHTRVLGVRHDSRQVTPGDLFVAVPGFRSEGARFVRDAVQRGARAILISAAQRDTLGSIEGLTKDVVVLCADNVRLALALASEQAYGEPTRALKVVGITGTNGKTTTSYLLASVLRAQGLKPVIVGTTGVIGLSEAYAIDNTTPEADDLSRIARMAVNEGATHLILEVSSHALSLHRVDALEIDVAALTNLSADHLDFHQSMQAYKQAKKRLFSELRPACCVINHDDAFGRELISELHGKVLKVGTQEASSLDIQGKLEHVDLKGLKASVEVSSVRHPFKTTLTGAHNLENCLLVWGIAKALGLEDLSIARALEAPQMPAGRLERVAHPFADVFVDYAHTPDALERTVGCLKPLAQGKLVVVFGAGGDRDRTKRPLMARAVARGADLIVLTDDNPRSEPSEQILCEVEDGLTGTLWQSADATLPHYYAKVANRAMAIRFALKQLTPGDALLVAGKGHERYQEVQGVRRPFDDKGELELGIRELTQT